MEWLINLLKSWFGTKIPPIPLPPTPEAVTPPIEPYKAPQTPSMPPNMIQKWATLIKQGEGARPELHNPGNLKYATLTASWGGTKGRQASDGGWLCQFPTEEKGFQALCNFLTLACEGELIISRPRPCNLQAFTVRYAGNPPQEYIDRIAIGLGVPLTVDIATFL